MILKRTPSLTEQAKNQIKQRILNAEFDQGRIPAETELATELGVSRTTIRDALSRLELEGTIYRKQGAGTFVNTASLQIHTRLEEIWSYEAMLQAHGYITSNRILAVEEHLAKDTEVTNIDQLVLAESDTILTIKKLFLADEQPVIFTESHIPTNLITRPYSARDFHIPIFQFLRQFCRRQLAYYLSEIVPLQAPDWLTAILTLPQPNQALICFEEVGYAIENEPIITATSYFRDDLLRLRLMRREI